jgi:hypothetical protein
VGFGSSAPSGREACGQYYTQLLSLRRLDADCSWGLQRFPLHRVYFGTRISRQEGWHHQKAAGLLRRAGSQIHCQLHQLASTPICYVNFKRRRFEVCKANSALGWLKQLSWWRSHRLAAWTRTMHHYKHAKSFCRQYLGLVQFLCRLAYPRLMVQKPKNMLNERQAKHRFDCPSPITLGHCTSVPLLQIEVRAEYAPVVLDARKMAGVSKGEFVSQLEAAVATLKQVFSELPSYDAIVPELLKGMPCMPWLVLHQAGASSALLCRWC